MTQSRVSNGHDNIHQALRKIKDKSNAKEVELIDLVASIYERIQDTKNNAVDSVKDTANAVNTSVHLYPWRYVGGAAALAFIVGLFVRR